MVDPVAHHAPARPHTFGTKCRRTDRTILPSGTPDVNAGGLANRCNRRAPICRPIPAQGRGIPRPVGRASPHDTRRAGTLALRCPFGWACGTAAVRPRHASPLPRMAKGRALRHDEAAQSRPCHSDRSEAQWRNPAANEVHTPSMASSLDVPFRFRSRSDADEVVELAGVGAAALDLFGEATEQGHVIQTRGRLPDVNASHAGESAGDIDDVDAAATGTFDLAAFCHGPTPFLPFRTVAGAARTCLPSSRPDPIPRDRDSTWRP